MITSKNGKFFKETGNNETFEVSSKRLSSSIKVKKDMIERLTKEVKEQQSDLKEVEKLEKKNEKEGKKTSVK